MSTESAPPRLPVRRETEDPRLPELFARGMRRPDGEVLNLFGTLAHHPDMFRRWLVFAAHVLSKNTLPARDRELLILRTGWNCKCRYEWGQHVLIARDCGLSDAEIERIKEGPAATEWAAPDRSLLVAADELHATSSMSDPTWEALAAVYTAEQMLDIVATVGNYHLVAMFLNTTTSGTRSRRARCRHPLNWWHAAHMRSQPMAPAPAFRSRVEDAGELAGPSAVAFRPVARSRRRGARTPARPRAAVRPGDALGGGARCFARRRDAPPHRGPGVPVVARPRPGRLRRHHLGDRPSASPGAAR